MSSQDLVRAQQSELGPRRGVLEVQLSENHPQADDGIKKVTAITW